MCFVETASKPCSAMCHLHAIFSYVATLVHVSRIAARYFPKRLYAKEAMLACFALAQRGKRFCACLRPCACLIELIGSDAGMFLWPNVGRGLVHV